MAETQDEPAVEAEAPAEETAAVPEGTTIVAEADPDPEATAAAGVAEADAAASVVGDEPVADQPVPAALKPGLASQRVMMVAERPEAMPPEIEATIPRDSMEQTRHRVAIWLAETKVLLHGLEHEIDGEHGRLIADLKKRL